MRRRHSVAEFSHRVALKNERENAELQRYMSNLDIARRQCLRSCETEILKVKQKAKKLHLNVMDYTERCQTPCPALNHIQNQALSRALHHQQSQAEVGEEETRGDGDGGQPQQLSTKSVGRAGRRHSIHGEQKRVTFALTEPHATRRSSIPDTSAVDGGISTTTTKAPGLTAFIRPPTRSLSAGFLHQPQRGTNAYPRTRAMMVNNYVNNNKKSQEAKSTRSPQRAHSVGSSSDLSSSVSYNDMQSPYKILNCIGRRTTSGLDQRDSASHIRTRRFMVVPTKKKASSSTLSRPKTAPNMV